MDEAHVEGRGQGISTNDRDEFLEVALGIGRRLCESALWRGETCLWHVPVSRPATPDASTAECGPFLYSGTAGIAYVLLQLSRFGGGDACRRTARGALRFSLQAEQGLPQATAGYYSGTAGLIAVLLEMAEHDDGGPWLEEAVALGDKLGRGLSRPGAYDLIIGEAGSLLGLLHLHSLRGDAASLAAACRLGDELLKDARREADGLSWDVMHPKVFRNLLGLSHGAGGIAVALLELYRWSGEASYMEAAFEGLRYEEAMSAQAAGGWPDFRHSVLSRYLDEGRQQDLVSDLLADRFRPLPPSEAMCAWCHGAPGAALVRSHFSSLGDLPELRGSMERAVAQLLEFHALDGSADGVSISGHSLCHGLCGNADILLSLGRRWQVAEWIEAAHSLARRSLEVWRSAGGRWRSGHPGQPEAPDLMCGEAGIGLFYLRCVAPEVAGCLLPVPTAAPPRRVPFEAERPVTAARHASLAHFPATVSALVALGVDLRARPIRHSGQLVEMLTAEVEGLGSTLDGGTGDEETVHRLRDLWGLEKRLFDLERTVDDFSRPFLDGLLRRRAELLDLGETLVCLSRGSSLWQTAYDWQPLFDGAAGLAEVSAQPTTHLLYTSNHRTRRRRLTPLAATMYRLLEKPIRVDDLLRRMVEHLRHQGLVDEDDREGQRAAGEKLHQILRHGYRDTMVDIVEPYDLRPSDITSELCVRCGECCRIEIQIPGDADYTEFVQEMLEEPLRATYPEASVTLVDDAPGPAYTAVKLGYCRHLHRGQGEGGSPCLTCGIYERRPAVCRDFNCVVWWRRQRLTAVGRTTADGVIDKVTNLMGRRRIGSPEGPTRDSLPSDRDQSS